MKKKSTVPLAHMVTKKPPWVFSVFWNGPLVKLNEFEQPNLRAYLFFHVFEKGARGGKLRAYCIFHAFGKGIRGEMFRAYCIFHACWTICFSWLYQKHDYGWDVLENLQRVEAPWLWLLSLRERSDTTPRAYPAHIKNAKNARSAGQSQPEA